MTGLNLVDRFLAVADRAPDAEAIVVAGTGGIRLTYEGVRGRVERAASVLQARGVGAGDRVGVLLANGNEHLEVLLACYFLRAVPVNLSHRDSPEGIEATLASSGARLVVHEPDLDPLVGRAIAIGADYEAALATTSGPPPVSGRSGDDHYLLYSGGTTGAPRGVLWRHDDLYRGALAPLADRAIRCMPASPFAHGTGQWMALSTLLHGGTVVCRRDRRFDPEATLDTIERECVSFLVLVGDAFARPIADLLDACRGRWTLPALTTVLSGGAVLSPSVKDDLLELLPTVMVVDGFGASETGGNGRMVSVAGSVSDGPPRFVVEEDTTVLDDDLRPVPPGDDRVGWLARRGPVPLGYDGDEAASADTFPVVDGVRWALSGDRAVHEADGTVTVLGRGATVINTGGHKVQPEEIERCLRTHPAVFDAIVVGVPDERFGERVAAVVAARADATPTLESLRRHCGTSLPTYKVPRHLVVVDEVRRSAAGKPDYAWAREVAIA